MGEDVKILTEGEIKERLKEFPGWNYGNNKISKEFVFKSFLDGLELVNKLAPYCEKIDHHPDIHISYKKIIFELCRYSIGGKVTDRDFLVAREIERLYEDFN